jgi:hypothetical protein
LEKGNAMVEGVELASWGDRRRYDWKVAAHRDNGKTGEAFLPNLAFLRSFQLTRCQLFASLSSHN